MKKALKRSLSFLLAITIIFGSMYVGLSEVDFSGLFAVRAEAAENDDKCGTNIHWEISEGVLTLTGTGSMYDYENVAVPWVNEISSIRKVVVGEGITYLGSYSLSGLVSVENIELPYSLEEIGEMAFDGSAFYSEFNNTESVTPEYESNHNSTHNKVFKFDKCEESAIRVVGSCEYTSEVVKPTELEAGYTKHRCVLCDYEFKDTIIAPALPDNVCVTSSGAETINLFNSGLKTVTGKKYSENADANIDTASFNNGGYDIFSRMPFLNNNPHTPVRMGYGFYISNAVTENVTLSVNAFDVDEEGGEYDEIYLVDENTGSRTVVGVLSGMNQQWNNTVLSISPDLFEVGHIYHFEFKISDKNGNRFTSWVVYIRNVSIQIRTEGFEDKNVIVDSNISANIDSSGSVTASTWFVSKNNKSIKIEFKATCGNYQYGSCFKSGVASAAGTNISANFNLDDGYPKGIYVVTAIIKDYDGNVLKTVSTTVGCHYNSVTYDSNGGSNNIPIDITPYGNNTVATVMFNNIPTKAGYEFCGWSLDKNAITPDFTVNDNTYVDIKDTDVVLYAVWGNKVCKEHLFKIVNVINATCNEDGEIKYCCQYCGYERTQIIQSEHSYVESDFVKATCTEDGYIEYKCSKCGELYTEIIAKAHQFIPEIIDIPQDGQPGIIRYTCEICGYSCDSEYYGDASHVLLVQDVIPWNVDNNPNLLNRLVKEGYIDGWDITTTSKFNSVDLSKYEVIVIANDQTTATYNKLAALNNSLCDFAENGGTIIYGACDDGWKGGELSYSLPGGVKTNNYYSMKNYIVDYSSSVVKGDLTDGISLNNDKLLGTYCSHTWFDKSTLPQESNIILSDANGNPTLVEYNYGNGKIIASGLTWEFYYTRQYLNNYQNFSKSVYDDLIVYASKNCWYSKDCHHVTCVEVKEPTCWNNGYEKVSCTICGDVISERTIPSKGHVPCQSYKIIEKGTCATDGLKGLYCSVCNGLLVADIIIPAYGHEMGEWLNEDMIECNNPGDLVRYCTHVNESDEYDACVYREYQSVEAFPHEFGELVVMTNPTCVESGVGYRRCNNCQEIITEIIPVLEHNPSPYWSIDEYPTCTQKGFKSHHCINCDARLDITEIDTNNHSFSNWIIDSFPTCTASGSKHRVCENDNCSYQEILVIQKEMHTYSEEWFVDEEATCDTLGLKSHHCINCGKKSGSTVIQAKGHQFEEWVYESEATCTQDGARHRTCLECGLCFNEVIPAYNHNYSDWYIDVEATCSTEGSKSQHCSICDNKINITTILPLNHEYGEWEIVEEATIEKEGTKKRACTACGYVDTQAIPKISESEYAISGSVIVSGTVYPGNTVTANTSLTVNEVEFTDVSYQWLRGGTPIAGETSKYYSISLDDLGYSISVRVTANAPYTGTITSGSKSVSLKKPTKLALTLENNVVNLSWDRVEYATSYAVYKCGFLGLGNRTLIAEVTDTSYKLEGLKSGSYYTYRVTAKRDGFESALSGFVTKIFYFAPTLSAYSDAEGVFLSWNSTAGTDSSSTTYSYDIYGRMEGDEWKKITNTRSTSYTHRPEKKILGIVFKYTMYDYYSVILKKTVSSTDSETGETTYSYSYSERSNEVFCRYVLPPQVSSVNENCAVTISWTSDQPGTKYEIYKNGEYLETVTGKQYIDSDVDDGEYYSYDVRIVTEENGKSAPGNTYILVDKQHDFDEPVIDSMPTCIDNGYSRIVCRNCQYEENIITPPTGHTLSEAWTIDEKPTCKKDGYKSKHCIDCDTKCNITSIAATGHNYGKVEYDVIPTCTEPGRIKQICLFCKYERALDIPELGHRFSSNWTVDVQPTCTEPGSKSHHCTSCEVIADVTEIVPTGHDISIEWTIDVEPTCYENGSKSHHCIKCDLIQNVTVVPMLEHTYSDKWTIDIEPTCLTDGAKSHHCKYCESKIDETIIPSTGHAYSEWVVTTESTCTEYGSHYRTCENCDIVETEEIEKTKHAFNGWKIVSAASCEKDGLKERACAYCDYVESVAILAYEHSYSSVYITEIAPTCTEPGYKANHCTKCGEAGEIVEVPALGHDFSDVYVIDVPATCTSDGEKSKHCNRCDERSYITIIPGGTHIYGGWNVVKEPTCTVDGQMVKTCEICDIIESEVLPALGHDYSKIWTVDTLATCTENGLKSHHCTRCDDKIDITLISATGHFFGAWNVEKEATCTEMGSRSRNCELCSIVENNEIKAYGHEYSTQWTIDVEPTCSATGSKSHHCLRCDDRTDVEEIPFGGHIFGKWYVVTQPTMDTAGVRAHKCYNCEMTEEAELPKLLKYTATFVADGDVVATVDFPEDATEIEIPEVPHKDKFNGEWENFTVRNKNFTVNAVYTPIPSEQIDGLTAGNKADYYSSTGEVEINLNVSAESKTIVTTTTKAVPLDIVFVLDQSGSMAEGGRKLALKNAVSSFSNEILADAIANSVDHRIAVVGFASGNNDNLNYGNTELLTSKTVKYNKITDADYKNALVSVNDEGVLNSVISSAINNIDAEGATKADLGLEMASNIFANNSAEGGRQRVVVFLTDGVPTSYSSFEYSVANVAIQNAYQLKNTYDATVYSVGVFDRTTSANRAVNNFMNYVSSNYNEEVVMKKTSKETTENTNGYYLDVSDVDSLSDVFTSIVEETTTHTGRFTNATLKYTLTKYFTLTSVQEDAIRKNAIEALGVKNEQITITRNADGTTIIIISGVEPWAEGDEYVIDFTFRATANGNTLKSGTYQVGTFESGVILENGEGYEAVFAPNSVDIGGTSGIAVFNINNIPYAINRLSSTTKVVAPATSFGTDYNFIGWKVPANLTLNNEVRVFDAELLKNEYKISWNIDGEITEVKYAVGDFIAVPEVGNNSIGGAFVGWDKVIPETMPSENLTITAIYDAHYHKYGVTKNFELCTEGGTLTYTCECGDTYTEEIAPCEHSWEVITASNNQNAIENAGSRCTVCGIKDSKALRLEGMATYQMADASYNTATYELDYVDENGDKHQPEGEIEISVQLDEVFETDIPEDATASVYRVNDDGTRTLLPSEQNGMNMTFVTDHFSTYEFEFTTGEQKYIFAQNGSIIDYENKLIFSNTYGAKEFKRLVTYLAPAKLTSAPNNYGYFGTGTSIELTNDAVADDYTVIVNGDLNGDGVCDALDVAYAALVSSGHKTATEEEIYAANGCVSDELDVNSYQNVVNICLAS